MATDDTSPSTSPTPANPPRRNSAAGKVAYDAYTAQVYELARAASPKSVPSPALPWGELSDEVRASWTAVARAVEADVLRPADPPKAAPVPPNAGPPTAHQG